MSIRASSLFALSLLCLACDPEAAHVPRVEASAQPIVGGKQDTKNKAVLAVVYYNGPASEFCTGYLVAPDLVLTARHCTVRLENPNGGCEGEGRTVAGESFEVDKMLVFTETSPSGPEAGLPVVEMLWPDDPTLCGNDLALLRLAEPLTKLTPIALRVDTPPVLDEALTVIGYGVTKPGPDTSSGTRRSRSDVTVSSVGVTVRASEGEWTVSEGPCVGDSGGPALDASGASIGVMSRGDQQTCKGMAYERLDVHAPWLQAAARESAKRLGGTAPAWAAEEPGAGGAGAAGAGGTTSEEGGGAAGEDGAGGAGEAGASAGPAAAPTSDEGGCTLAAPVEQRAGGRSLRGLGLVVLGLLLTRRRR